MAMSYTSYLEGRIEELETLLGKVTTALHSLQHANDVEIATCKKGICPKVDAALHPAKAALRDPTRET